PIISLLLSTPSLPTMHQQIGRKQQNILSVPPDIKLSDFLSHGQNSTLGLNATKKFKNSLI
ncbi:MAG: hypothetical protein AB7U51_14015, partial [Arcobacter sp.]|uniref:hypothetical protein n=1 Tax=Arcobacter sp. TaxID=1872629 RepID=UPI003CFF87E0